MSKKLSGIYKITNTANGKIYIGQSINLNSRKASHFSCLSRGVHKNPILQSSYNKWGRDKFIFSIIVICENLLLNRIEVGMINYHRKILGKRGVYNVSDGGDTPPMLGRKHTKEAREKISRNSKNRIVSEETRSKISLANLGKKRSDEAKRKMSIAKKGDKCYWFGFFGENHPRHGKKHTAESKNKMRVANLGSNHPSSKCVNQLEITTGEIIKTHDCISVAARETGAGGSHICAVANNKRKTAGGYKWEYV